MEVVGVTEKKDIGEQPDGLKIYVIGTGLPVEGLPPQRYDITDTIPVRYGDSYAFVYPIKRDGSGHSAVSYIEVTRDGFGLNTLGFTGSDEAGDHGDDKKRALISAGRENEKRETADVPSPRVLFEPLLGSQARDQEK
jgi:hypothetical protein